MTKPYDGRVTGTTTLDRWSGKAALRRCHSVKPRAERERRRICEKAMQAEGTASANVLGHIPGLGLKIPVAGVSEQGEG